MTLDCCLCGASVDWDMRGVSQADDQARMPEGWLALRVENVETGEVFWTARCGAHSLAEWEAYLHAAPSH